MEKKLNPKSEEGLKEMEELLGKQTYFSGKELPGAEDSQALGEMKEVPDRLKFPNVFAWWWSLALF